MIRLEKIDPDVQVLSHFRKTTHSNPRENATEKQAERGFSSTGLARSAGQEQYKVGPENEKENNGVQSPVQTKKYPFPR